MPQPDAYLRGGMTVVGQHEDAARVLAADADQVGDAVHQNATEYQFSIWKKLRP
jgi:hypothetical protein